MAVKHSKVVNKPDGYDTSKLRPSDWNADHVGTNIHDHSNDENGGLLTGIQGPSGPQGEQGIQGLKGDKGDKGDTGSQGLQGVPGNDGATGPQGAQGVPGQDSTVPGPQGPQGLQGTQGIQGVPGADSMVPGPAGPKGDQGIQGIQGVPGVSDVPGPQGDQGIQGIQGVKGDTGNTGSQGPAGTTRLSINVQALTSSPGDGATVYFGNMPKAPTTTANISKVYVRAACTIKRAEIYVYSGTAGTNENWSLYIRKNNTTDTLIATLGVNTNERKFTNAALNIAMADGDYFEIKGVQPTWATNPLTTIYGGYIVVEE